MCIERGLGGAGGEREGSSLDLSNSSVSMCDRSESLSFHHHFHWEREALVNSKSAWIKGNKTNLIL